MRCFEKKVWQWYNDLVNFQTRTIKVSWFYFPEISECLRGTCVCACVCMGVCVWVWRWASFCSQSPKWCHRAIEYLNFLLFHVHTRITVYVWVSVQESFVVVETAGSVICVPSVGKWALRTHLGVSSSKSLARIHTGMGSVPSKFLMKPDRAETLALPSIMFLCKILVKPQWLFILLSALTCHYSLQRSGKQLVVTSLKYWGVPRRSSEHPSNLWVWLIPEDLLVSLY